MSTDSSQAGLSRDQAFPKKNGATDGNSYGYEQDAGPSSNPTPWESEAELLEEAQELSPDEVCTCTCSCDSQQGLHCCPVCGMALRKQAECACAKPQWETKEACKLPRVKLSSRAKGAFTLLALTDLSLRIIALRRAVKRGDRSWTLPLAFVNSLGILPAFYLSTHSKTH